MKKLVINVDNYKIEACKRRKEEGQNAWYHDMVLNGKPLEKEIVKELETIKSEIELMNFDFGDYYDNTDIIIEMVSKVINKRISELKGESE